MATIIEQVQLLAEQEPNKYTYRQAAKKLRVKYKTFRNAAAELGLSGFFIRETPAVKTYDPDQNVVMRAVRPRSLTKEITMNYIVSTIQYGALVNRPLLRNLVTFADNHNVEKIYLFIMPGKDQDETAVSPVLLDDPRIEFLFLDKTGLKLNSNLKLFDTQILASQINPLTGFNRKLHRDYSYLLPSPKIRYMSFPNTSKYPRFLATTGALTHGNYRLHTAQGRKAELEHEYGFAFIEVVDNKLFNYHPVAALKNGNFNYNREYYANGQMTDQQPEALVLGDIHVGDTCPKTWKVTLKMIRDLKPKRVFLHDLFNGHSINHHERNNNLSKAAMWNKKMHVLQEEVEQCLSFLTKLTTEFPDVQFYIVESNHDQFLAKYIGIENFLQDGQNSVFACRLFVAVSEGHTKPILELALHLVGKLPHNVTFLGEDDEYRVSGIGLGQHGHRGISGSRGTSLSFSNNNLKLITGHEHSPRIWANGLVVGTSTHLRLGYTHGPSAWLNAHAVLYKSGKYSLLTIIT